MAVVFVPIESWIIQRNFDWETMFQVSYSSDLVPHVISFTILSQVLTTIVAYKIGLYILDVHGLKTLAKSSILSLSVFFTSIGLFHDTLLYAGSLEEYHSGVSKSFFEFFSTKRFEEAYVTFSLVFGPPMFYISISWNSGYTKQEKLSFIWCLFTMVIQLGFLINLVYMLLWISGAVPPSYDLNRLAITNGVYLASHFGYIAPLLLSSTKEKINDNVM